MNEENSDNLATLDGIIRALYDSISGPADKKRDLSRFRSLFIPEARLIPVRFDEAERPVAFVTDADEFFKAACEYFRVSGFFEREVARRVDSFGHITHVLSTYESRHNEDDPEPFSRGVNSIQLFHDSARYRVVTIFWDSERPDNPIPEKYLS